MEEHSDSLPLKLRRRERTAPLLESFERIAIGFPKIELPCGEIGAKGDFACFVELSAQVHDRDRVGASTVLAEKERADRAFDLAAALHRIKSELKIPPFVFTHRQLECFSKIRFGFVALSPKPRCIAERKK